MTSVLLCSQDVTLKPIPLKKYLLLLHNAELNEIFKIEGNPQNSIYDLSWVMQGMWAGNALENFDRLNGNNLHAT